MQDALVLLENYEQSGQGWFWSTNAAGEIDYISECAASRLGKDASALRGQPLSVLFAGEDEPSGDTERSLSIILSKRKTFTGLQLRVATQAEELWWAISGRPERTPSGEFAGFKGNGWDVTTARHGAREAARLSLYDSLTGLSNRHRMSSQLENMVKAFRLTKRNCATILLDLDRFKNVNDTLGHPAGDALLKQVAERLARVTDSRYELGRIGGDEFQIIIPNVDDRGELGALADRIITILSQPYRIDGRRCMIGASVGIAIAPYDGETGEELVKAADLALYAAKAGGRGQFRFYSKELQQDAERRQRIEQDLGDALSAGQISLAYQPLVSASTNVVVGVEALMRWQHPEFGSISPATFIPIAEDSNQIGELGAWALRQACADAANWPSNIKVAVNVSPSQFADEKLPSVVTQALAHSGLAAQRLELELTESIFLEASEVSSEMFSTLKRLGVRLVLDDFGTGYSSLGYLRETPFDKIKIDQCFIRGITRTGSRNAGIIKAIVSLAKALEMDTTAEGIEAHDELDVLRELKVDQIQGYIYSKALAADEVTDGIKTGQWCIAPDGPRRARAQRKSVFRKVGLIHDNHRYDVMLRNISRTGCLVDGLADIPDGTEFVVDFGGGQLALSRVRRTGETTQGLEFEKELVDDGAGGLVTRHRVSPFMLAAAGMPLGALGNAAPNPPTTVPFSMPRFGLRNGKKG